MLNQPTPQASQSRMSPHAPAFVPSLQMYLQRPQNQPIPLLVPPISKLQVVTDLEASWPFHQTAILNQKRRMDWHLAALEIQSLTGHANPQTPLLLAQEAKVFLDVCSLFCIKINLACLEIEKKLLADEITQMEARRNFRAVWMLMNNLYHRVDKALTYSQISPLQEAENAKTSVILEEIKKFKNIYQALTILLRLIDDPRPAYQTTPLHRAVKANNLLKIKFLLKLGLSPLNFDENFKTPFDLATELGHLEAKRLLSSQISANQSAIVKLSFNPFKRTTYKY